MPENAEAKSLKERRKNVTPAPDPEKITGLNRPVGVGHDEPPRNYFTLGHPDEPRAIIGAEPLNADGIIGDDYVQASEDAFELIVPPGCRTGTSRLMWSKGNYVPIERYRAWEASRKPVVAKANAE